MTQTSSSWMQAFQILTFETVLEELHDQVEVRVRHDVTCVEALQIQADNHILVVEQVLGTRKVQTPEFVPRWSNDKIRYSRKLRKSWMNLMMHSEITQWFRRYRSH